MMKTIELLIPAPGTSEVKYYLPLKDPSRLISAMVGVGGTQAGAAPVKFGKAGETYGVLSADLNGTAAGAVKAVGKDASQTEAKLNQIFDKDTPVEISINLQTDGTVAIQLVVDPFVIGKQHGFAS